MEVGQSIMNDLGNVISLQRQPRPNAFSGRSLGSWGINTIFSSLIFLLILFEAEEITECIPGLYNGDIPYDMLGSDM
jgi:hypothetical protein